MMTLWDVSRNVFQILESRHKTGIPKILMAYPLEQRRFIVAIQHQDSSLLFHAIKHKLFSVVKYFLTRCDADPNSFGFIRGRQITCLAVATYINCDILVKILLQSGADTEIIFSEMTALYYACQIQRFKIVKRLIEHGANLNYRTLVGRTCLMASMNNMKLFKYLVSAGADINFADGSGITCLHLALAKKKSKVISFLLGLKETDVRSGKRSDIYALYTAIKTSPVTVINRIINKGSFTHEEVEAIFNYQSYRLKVAHSRDKERKLWLLASRFSVKPSRNSIFETLHRTIKSEDLLKADDIRPLSALELMSEFTLHTEVNRAHSIRSCELFFKKITSAESATLFPILTPCFPFVETFFMSDNVQKSQVVEVFDMMVNYINDIYIRVKRMTSQERSVYGFKIEYLMFQIIRCFYLINRKFPEEIYLFSDSIKRLLRLDIRGFRQKTLLQKCVIICKPLVERFFLACRADVNSSDELGRTVLNDLAETADVSPDLISLIIDYGFDFHEVKYDQYCLPCRLKRRDLLPTPVKHTSLQCLAVKAFCENKMTSFSEVPYHLMPIVKSHLYN